MIREDAQDKPNILSYTGIPYSLAVTSFHDDMSENAFAIYLASKIMTKTTKSYPKPALLNRFLYQLDGLDVDVSAIKWGDQLLLNFDLSLFYLQTDSSKREALFDYFHNLPEDCTYENGLFPENIFVEEKRNLMKEIRIQNIDPIQNHFQLFLEKMFAQEPFRYSLLGKEEQINRCTNKEVSAKYKHFLKQSGKTTLSIGAFSSQEKQVLRPIPRESSASLASRQKLFSRKSPSYFEEESDNQQTWLFLGYRHDITPSHPLYPALTLYQQILGKIPDALLIHLLREELSLCYNVEMFMPAGKEAMFITAGVLLHDRSAFMDEIQYLMKSFPLIRKKNTLLAIAKKKVLNTIAQWMDFPSYRLSFELESKLMGAKPSLQDYCQNIEQAQWEDLQEASRHIWLDTVYTSRGKHL